MTRVNVDELFSPANRYCFLAGAGISVDPPSNLPLAKDIVCQVVASLQLENNTERKMLEDFDHGLLRFEQFMELISNFYDPHLNILDHLAMCRSPNMIHNFLAHALERGDSVFTTNFECLIELACTQRGINARSIYGSMHAETNENGPERQVWKLHGSLQDEQGKDTRESVVATLSRVGQQGEAFSSDPYLRNAFQKNIQQRHLVVLGYSGLDDYDIVPMISHAKSDKRIIWVWHDPNVHPAVAFRYQECAEQMKDARSPCDKVLALGNWSPEQLVVLVGRTSSIVSELNKTLTGNRDVKLSADEYKIPGHYYAKWRIRHALEDWKHGCFVGKYYLSRGDYKAAYCSFLSALQEARRVGAFFAILGIMLSLSESCIRSGHTRLTLKHLEEYYSLLHNPEEKSLAKFYQALTISKPGYLVDYYQHLATCYTQMELYDEAQVALDNSPTEEDTIAHARKLYETARILYRKGDNFLAIQKAKQAIRIHRRQGNLNSLAICLLFVGVVLMALNGLDEAERCFDESARICGLTKNSHVLRNCEMAQRQLHARR